MTIKIDPCNFELCRFKFGLFFETQCMFDIIAQIHGLVVILTLVVFDCL